MNKPTVTTPEQDLAHLAPYQNDEIDLGELIRNLIGQWKLIGGITAVGAILSIAFALSQPKIYKVESAITTPTLTNLGELQEQSLVPVNEQIVLEKTVEELISTSNQADVFANSDLKKAIAKQSDLNNEQLFLTLRDQLKIERLDNELFASEENQALKQVKISLESTEPVAATHYVQSLIAYAMESAKTNLIADVTNAKIEKTKALTEQIKAETNATQATREAMILRIEEANQLKLTELNLQLSLLQQKAKSERLNRIDQLQEALTTAVELKITEPVTWDDLRKSNNSNAQILNELDSQNKAEPLYFQGSRLLNAEITMLKNRTNDLLYVSQAADIQKQKSELLADPKLKALKARTDDTPYIENLAELQMKLAKLNAQPTDFPTVQVAKITAPAVVPAIPIKPNKKLIVVAGTVLAGFLGLFIALLAIAIKPKEA